MLSVIPLCGGYDIIMSHGLCLLVKIYSVEWKRVLTTGIKYTGILYTYNNRYYYLNVKVHEDGWMNGWLFFTLYTKKTPDEFV